jgi:hypothetical protein
MGSESSLPCSQHFAICDYPEQNLPILRLPTLTQYLEVLCEYYTRRFIMFSVITNIYNKKTKGPALMQLFTAAGKLKRFFWQIEMFDVCTTGDTVHIDMIFKCLRHGSLQQWRISMHACWRVCGRNLNIVSMCAVSPVVHSSNISSCKKISFPVVLNNSIKVFPLRYALWVSCYNCL